MYKKLIALCTAAVMALLVIPAPSVNAERQEGNLNDYENSVFASNSETGNFPVNTIDGDLGTKWASEGVGQWLCFRLEKETKTEKIGFSFTLGSERIYQFSVQASSDMENWTTVFEGESCGTTDDIEWFKLKPVKARFLRFVGKGSNKNLWNNINEVSGIVLKKSDLKINIDGRNENYINLPYKKGDKIFLPAKEALESLGYKCTYDSEKNVVSARNNEKTIDLDGRKNSIKINDSINNAENKLEINEDGVLMLEYDLLPEFSEMEIKIDGENVSITTERYTRTMTAYEKIDQEFLKVLDWIVDIYDPETGGFYNTVSGAEYDGFYPSLEASAYVYQIINSLGAGDNIPEEFKQKLIRFFQTNQNPDTGFFEEKWPKATSYNDRDKMRVYGVVVDKLKQLGAEPLYLLPSERSTSAAASINQVIIREAESEKEVPTDESKEIDDSADIETSDGESAPTESGTAAASGQYDYDKRISLPEGTPEYCASVNQFIAHIETYDWDVGTWGAGDKTYEDLSYILLLDKSVQQPYIDATINWLNNQQNPETGYWNNSGDIGFNAVSGAFKIARIYDRFGICPPNAMQIADTIVETLRGGYTASAACYVRNPLSTLQILMKYDAEVQSKMLELEPEIVELYVKMIHDMFHEDGGASSAMYCSNQKFGGLVAGRRFCEGDVDGTLQMSIARVHLSQIFGRSVDNKYLAKYSEEFWNKILSKKPVVKKSFDAVSGVAANEDFENVEKIDDLFDRNWSFKTGNIKFPVQSLNGKQNRYLLLEDTGVTEQESARCAFDKVYGDASVEFSLMLDREMPYQEKKNDMSYTFFTIGSRDTVLLSMNVLDNGSDKITLAFQNSKSGSVTYNSFGTAERGEWFNIRLDFTHDRYGTMHMKCYLNGKLQPAAEDALLISDAEYFDVFEICTSTARCSKMGLDNFKVTVK